MIWVYILSNLQFHTCSHLFGIYGVIFINVCDHRILDLILTLSEDGAFAV